MKKTFYLQPRKTGKTTKAKQLFLESPFNTLYVTFNPDYIIGSGEIFNNFSKNIIRPHKFNEIIRGRRFNNIILDEYLFFEKKKIIYFDK